MDPIAELRSAFRLVVGGFQLCLWILVTIWEGGRAVVYAGRHVLRLPAFRAETARCPRGHDVPVYGVWECTTCPAMFEGYVFRKCPTCRMGAAWTPCPVCQLPVRNAHLR